MNISSMLSVDNNNVASEKQAKTTTDVQLENQPPVLSSALNSSSPSAGGGLQKDQASENSTSQAETSQTVPTTISTSVVDQIDHLVANNNSAHHPNILSPLKHMNGNIPSHQESDSIVAGILPSSYEFTSSTFTPSIDQKYKATFENNVNIINKLDHYQQVSHNLKLLKFDEAKLNNYLISTGQFASNYIDRVVAEDISSRNNKISDTNKNKELNHIDYSKPLHHNSTRGKEFKWGSTREIHKVDNKTRRRRTAATDDASKNTASNGTKDHAHTNSVGTVTNNSPHLNDSQSAHDKQVSQSKTI